jgi:hypothetical protein
MSKFDPALFGRQAADEVARTIGAIICPLTKRIADLETRLEAAEGLRGRMEALEVRATMPRLRRAESHPDARRQARPPHRLAAQDGDVRPGSRAINLDVGGVVDKIGTATACRSGGRFNAWNLPRPRSQHKSAG